MSNHDEKALMVSCGAIPEQAELVNQIDSEEYEYMEEEIISEDPWEATRTFTSPLTGHSFELNPQGVYWVHNKKVVSEWEDVTEPLCGPLRVLGVARDSENRGWSILLLVKDPEGFEHPLTIRKDQLDGETITQALRSAGLTVVASYKAKEMLVTFLQECPPEEENPFRLTDKTGWHDKAFILPDGRTLGHAEENYILTKGKPKDRMTFTPSGRHQDWIDNVSYLCNGNGRLLFAVSVAFVAPLLRLTGSEGGGFNFVGDSSTGKSTAITVGASAYGHPKHYVQSWRATSNGLEFLAQRHNDMLMAIDEMGQMAPKEIGEAAYMLANGQGKQRMSSSVDMRDRLEWTTMILSSGEITLAEHMSEGGKKTKAGQEVRLADIPADAGKGHGLFEELHHCTNGADFSNTLKENALKYHGTAVPLFLRGITTNMEGFHEGYRQIKERFLEESMPTGSSSQVRRLAEKMALIAAAGEFATHLGITGWTETDATWAAVKCFGDWIKLRGGTDRQEVNQIINQARSFIERHGDARFVEMNWNGNRYLVDEARTVHNRAGYKRTKDGETDYLIMPSAFNEEICEGISRVSAVKVLIDAGILIPGKGGNATTTHRVPDVGVMKLYHFSGTVLAEE
ncbi:membrane protein [Desulfuromonas versatilis]|uniref:Membrane protein n=1 Tax=Desulfuromonas versatilis TaxID=2802975 RepID=A0ABM8HRK1_9BACT|nr:DUF927 domain-containing protein [Desulfuromonas versatilis]BCR03071.1 membrane protein [Desulfuromonas versatilis]